MPHNSRRLGSKIQPSTDLSACVGMACGCQPVAKCGMCFDGNTAWGHRTVEVWGVWYSQAQICHADISYCYITECGKLHVCKQGLIAGFLWCKVVFCCFWWMKWTFLPALTFTPTLLTHTHTHTTLHTPLYSYSCITHSAFSLCHSLILSDACLFPIYRHDLIISGHKSDEVAAGLL